jgi:hypothetical protein
MDGDTGNRSNERLTNLSVPNFVFWNAKFEDECLIEFDHNENDLSFIFNQ